MALDLGSPQCNLELSAVVAGIAGQPMLWEVVHPRAEVLSLSGAVFRLTLLDAPWFWRTWSCLDELHLLLRGFSRGV